jgi:hypothetical protein
MTPMPASPFMNACAPSLNAQDAAGEPSPPSSPAVTNQSSDGGTGVQPFVHAEAAWEVPAPRNISGKQEGQTGIKVGTSQTPGSPMLSALTLPISAGQAPGPSETTNFIGHLIHHASLLRLPRFAPDLQAMEDAMHDPGAPRALEADPVWADEAPLFLRMANAS